MFTGSKVNVLSLEDSSVDGPSALASDVIAFSTSDGAKTTKHEGDS